MNKNKKKKSQNRLSKSAIVLSSPLLVVPSIVSPTNPIVAEASAGTQTVSFAESTSASQSKTITIPNLEKVSSITSSSGNVSYTVNGDQVTINVSGGTPTRTVWDADYYSKTATGSKTSSSQTGFADTIPYSDADGYSGTLNKSGTPTVISGVYTPSASKTVTAQTSASYSDAEGYKGTLTQYVYSGSYTPASTKYVSTTEAEVPKYSSESAVPHTFSYNKDGYKGTLSNWNEYISDYIVSRKQTGTVSKTGTVSTALFDGATTGIPPSTYNYGFFDNDNPSELSITDDGTYYQGTIPRVKYWRCDFMSTVYYCATYTGTVYKKVYTYWGSYNGNVTKPASDTRVYRYQGTVTKPASDTRVWQQNYSGTVYKGKNINYYGYNVTINYETDSTPPVSPTITPSTTSPTNQNVTATISYPSDALTKEYRINGGTWTAYSTAITMTANGTIEARGTDKAGNVSAIKSLTISNIDKTAPTAPTFSASTTSPTNQNVSVAVNFPSDASVKEVSINDGAWTSYSSAVVMSANGKVEARAKDVAGNYSAISTYNVTNIDKTAPSQPTLSADVTAPTNGNVVVTATYPADASVKEYSVNGGSTWTAYTAPVTMTGNGTFQARAKDSAGNYSTVASYSVTNIDKTPPSNPTFVSSITSPTNQNVSVTINYPTDASVKQYKIGATGTWTDYTTPVVLSSNNTVYARGIDSVGNVSNEVSFAVSNIDKTAPTTPTFSANTTATNDDVLVTVNFPSDASVKEVSINDGAWVAYTGAVTMTANGKVEARGKDVAGNYSAIGVYNVTNIDKTPPAKATLTASTTSPTNQNVSVTIAYPSDANVKEYKIGSTGTWTAYTTPVVLSSNNTVYARSTDAVGNVSAENSLVVNNIDKVAPSQPAISADVTTPTNDDVVLTATYPADASVKEYSLNGGTSWVAYTSPVTMTANGTFQARAKDSAGNYSAVASYSVSNIDKTPPANATLSASTTSPTNQNVSVTIAYPADAVTKQYKIGSTGTWTAYTTPVVLSSNNTVYARSIDAVGNVSAETNLSVSNIDKTAPTTPTISADVTEDTNGNVVLTATYPSDASVKEYSVNGGSTWTAYTAPVTMTSNGTFQARAKDVAGNVSAVGSYSVTNIDKTPPANATFVASTTAPTNQDVSVTINYPADSSTKQYKVGSAGTWTTYSTPVVLASNNTVYARSIDAVGNVSAETNYVVSNIDKVAPTTPTVSADVTEGTNGNVVLTATFPSDSSVKEYRVNGGTWTSYVNPVTMTANGKLEVRAKDVAGNYSAIGVYNVTNIDKTPPANATLTASTTAPTNQNVSVAISYPADATVKQYKIGSTGTWTAYSTPVELSANNTVYARSYDAVGNVSAETSLVVSNIDKVAPNQPTIFADVTEPTNGDVVLTATFSADSTVKEYRLNGGSWTSYANPVTLSANGTFEVRGKDSAGNYSSIGSYSVTNIDKTAPVNATFVADKTSPTNTDVKVTISYPADASVQQYKIGSTGTWTAYSTPVTVSSNNTVYARSYDAVGNLSNESSYVVSNIDKVAPITPTVQADVKEDTNGNVVLTATFPSDASVKEFRKDGGSWTAYSGPITFVSNGKFEVRAKDVAGNYSAIGVYNVTNIDKTAPETATFVADKTAPTNTNVAVTINYPDDATVKQYKVGSTGTWTTYSSPVVLTTNNTVYARSYDAVGNVSNESNYVVSNIDKVAPSAPTITADKTIATNTDVVLTATFPSDSEIKQYRINGGTWYSYEAPVTMIQNGTLEVRAIDDAGNISNVGSYNVTNIDKTPPSIATLTPSTTVPTNQDVLVTIAYPFDAVTKQYKIGSTGTWTTYSNPVVVSANNTVYARSVDAVGNMSNESNFVVSNIDKVAPTTPSITADVTVPTNTNVVLNAIFSNDSSVKEYRVNGGNWTAYVNPVTFTENGTFEVRSRDVAGNYSSVAKYSVTNIDKDAPNTPSLVADQTSPTNKDVNVTISYPNDAVLKEYRVDGGAWKPYNTPIVMTNNGVVEARATDNADNVSEIGKVTVSNIDKVAPVQATFTPSKTAPTNTDVSVVVSYPTDAVVKEFRKDGGVWTAYTNAIPFSQNGKVEARSYDNAGNVSTVSSYEVTNIDKVKPVVATFQADKTSPTNTNVVVTATFPTDVVKKEVRVNNGSWTTYTTPITMTDNGVVEVRGTDNAGNVSDISRYEVSNIDRVAPENPTYSVTENQNKIVVSGASDAKTFYRINDSSWVEYKEAIVLEDGMYNVDVKSIDPASNESEVVTFDTQLYRDSLSDAETHVAQAESVQTQESVDVATTKVDKLPHEVVEYQPLKDRVEDIQKLIDARKAIELATATRNPDDVAKAQEKIDLLDGSNPIIIDIMDDVKADFEVADILTLVAKERYDILSTRYEMSKVAYNSLVQTYYAIKYTGDTMYKMAKDKVALVPSTDKYYDFVYEQYNNLNVDYDEFVEKRQQTDAEIKAEASVQVMESKYDPTLALNTQNLINAVEDTTVRASLQQRLDTAKAKYEASLLDKASQTAITAVEKAESTKNAYYVTDAYKKVNALTDETLKAELKKRLQAVEAQMALDKLISDATRSVQFAEQYKTQSYIDTAQSKIDALPEGEAKTSLQQRLDAVKSGVSTPDQATIIKNATSYVSLAQTMKTQYYVDKAQGYVDQITDEAKKAELQAKLDAIVVK